MGNLRPRYNAKGRATKKPAKERSHRTTNGLGNGTDSAALSWAEGMDVIDDEERHRRRTELLANSGKYEPEEKMSAKKKRRLDQYIEKKLKKERRGKLLKALERSQSTVHDPLAFVSTSSIHASSKPLTQQQELDRRDEVEAKKRERAKGLVLQRRGRGGYHSDSEESSSDDDMEKTKLASGNGKGSADAQNKAPRINSIFSGAVAVEGPQEAQPQKLSPPALPSSKRKGTQQAPSAPMTTGTKTNSAGSGLAAGATVVIVQGRRKRRKVEPAVALSEEDEGSEGGTSPSEDSDVPVGSDDESASESSDQEVEPGEDEEEWGGISDDGEQGGGTDDAADTMMAEAQDRGRDGKAETETAKSRVRGSFRDWANARLREVEDASDDDPAPEAPEPTSSLEAVPTPTAPPKPKEPPSKAGPMGAQLELPDTPLFRQRTTHIPLTRSIDIEPIRSALPVVAEEDAIMDTIRRHEVVVICGETGSGKTTQVPQFLFEAGFGNSDGDNPGMIGITQPRRVAAVSMAARVEEEMGLQGRGIVGHQIRYDATTGANTQVKFMTDGVLLRELAADLLLTKYSVLIIDEAHERSVNTDVLIGVLSRVVRLRLKKWLVNESDVKPLRLVIMSATLRVTDFTENKTLFPIPPPVINVSARQHPVVVHFNRRTPGDYVTEAYKKVSKIHARLPPGGVLVFLTGQNEIATLCRKLEKRFGRKAVEARKQTQERMLRPSVHAKVVEANEGDGEVDGLRRRGVDGAADTVEAEDVEFGKEKDLAADVDDGQQQEDPDALDTDDEDDLIIEGVENQEDSLVPMHILPLYSLLPNDQQMRVFQTPPSDSRLVVVSTNVAETSLTIPNIKYVVDAGRAKERQYDLTTGVQDFTVSWISKASAAQRSGRAGRTGPGHCYRLYSSAVYENHFEAFAKPEIARTPIEGVVLQMKSMNIDAVVNFPFPTPPDRLSLQKAETTLTHLGALAAMDDRSKLGARITELGKAMASYPLAPRFARMLVSGNQHGCLPYVIALVSIFSVGDPFLRDDALFEATNEDTVVETEEAPELGFINSEEVKQKEARKLVRRKYFEVQRKYGALGSGTSDPFKALGVVGAYEYEGGGSAFCQANFVRPKAMEEIHKLRSQISRIVQATTGIDAGFSPKLLPPSEIQCKVLRQLLLAAFSDQVAVRKDLVDKGFGAGAAKRSQGKNVPYRVAGLLDDIHVHPSSLHFLQQAPEFLVYHELHRASKIWIRGLTAVNGAWLPVLAKGLCTFSKPLEEVEVDSALGKLKKATDNERECFVIPKFGGPTLDVALGAVKATQKRVNGRWIWQ